MTTQGSAPLPPIPSFGAVVRAQMSLVVRTRGQGSFICLSLILLQVVAAAGFGVLLGVSVDIGEEETTVGFGYVDQLIEGFELSLGQGAFALLVAFGLMGVFAFFFPFAVWADETPSKRGYHWAMPVDRGRHDLLRFAAGACFLAAVLAAMYGVTLATAALAGRWTELEVFDLWAWFCLCVGPLLPYTWTSIFCLRCEHPAGWFWGIPGVLCALWTLAAALRWESVLAHLRDVVVGPLGVVSAVAGPVASGTLGLGLPSGVAWLPGFLLWTLFLAAGVWSAASLWPVRRS